MCPEISESGETTAPNTRLSSSIGSAGLYKPTSIIEEGCTMIERGAGAEVASFVCAAKWNRIFGRVWFTGTPA